MQTSELMGRYARAGRRSAHKVGARQIERRFPGSLFYRSVAGKRKGFGRVTEAEADGERGRTGEGERKRGTRNAERGTRSAERKTRIGKRGGRNSERGAERVVWGMGGVGGQRKFGERFSIISLRRTSEKRLFALSNGLTKNLKVPPLEKMSNGLTTGFRGFGHLSRHEQAQSHGSPRISVLSVPDLSLREFSTSRRSSARLFGGIVNHEESVSLSRRRRALVAYRERI